MKHERTLAYVAFAIVCVVWGTTYLAIRVAIETIPPFLLTATRFVTAGVVMFFIARLIGERAKLDARTLIHLAVIGFCMVTVGNLAVVWAEQWVPSGMAALLVATSPFWMAIMERLRGDGERIDLRTAIGMFLGFAGVALLVMPNGSDGRFDVNLLLGALAIQVGAIGWQYGSLRGKYHIKNVPLMTSASLQMFFGGAIAGAIGLLRGEGERFTLNPRTFSALAYLTVAGSIIAYSAYVFMLAHLRTTQTSVYAYVNPVIAVIAGWLLLDEALTVASVVAMIVILAGVALVQTGALRKKAAVIVPMETEAKQAA